MQFRERSQNFRSKVEKDEKKFYSEQYCFPQNVPLGWSIRLLAILPVFFAESPEIFCSNSEIL